MSLNSEVFLITAYTPTLEKLDNLRELVKTIKQFGYGVCLATHSETPQDIIDRCDYFIYDKKNEVNHDPDIAYWIYHTTPRFKISYKQYGSMSTHIIPITRLVIGGLQYLKTVCAEKVFLIEYDTVINNTDIFDSLSSDLDTYTISSFYSSELNNKDIYLVGMIAVNLTQFDPSLMKTDSNSLLSTYREYFNSGIFPVTERIQFDIMWSKYTIKWNDIEVARKSMVFETSRNTNGYGDKSYLFHCYNDVLHFFCSNNTDQLWKFDIIINDKNHKIEVEQYRWAWVPLIEFNLVDNIKLLLNNTFIRELDMKNSADIDAILKWVKFQEIS
jgi:hypothetical protein